jgi:hypothetical protein
MISDYTLLLVMSSITDGDQFPEALSCPSYLILMPEIIDNSLTIHYSRSHYGNEDFNTFGLYSVAFKGQKSAT